MLIKVKATGKSRAEIIQITEIFKGKIVSVHKSELGIELSGSAQKVSDFINMMADFGIIEIARTGRVAISRNPGATAQYSAN